MAGHNKSKCRTLVCLSYQLSSSRSRAVNNNDIVFNSSAVFKRESKKKMKIFTGFEVLRSHEHLSLLLCKTIKMNDHGVVTCI